MNQKGVILSHETPMFTYVYGDYLLRLRGGNK